MFHISKAIKKLNQEEPYKGLRNTGMVNLPSPMLPRKYWLNFVRSLCGNRHTELYLK